MGSCCSHRVAAWTDDDGSGDEKARGALAKLREKKRRAAEACTVVKVKISKKQLEELLRSRAGVNGGGGVEVLDDRLLIAGIMSRGVVCHARQRQRRWEPELQPVPEMAGEDGCI